jgi:hypothetical protein
MKLADRTIETHSAGVASANQFSIAQTSKMFKILSDSLYSDKVMAVIRELSTNAYDSHVSAGNKNPFKVTLPTMGNPNFCVRDYGTGLSQADMEELYTTYGASNKNDSNDFVGCLGLGSKSPFAYTKSFTTASYFNGKKYTYIAAIDDNGVPTLNLFSTTDTDEPNGLEISFAVKQHDFHEFSNKAMRIFHYFRMKPILEGGIHNHLQDHKYSNSNIVISGDGWRVCRLNNGYELFPNNSHKIESGIVAIMGNIAYPVQSNQLVGEEKQEQTNDAIQRWNRAFQKADIDSWKTFVSEILNQGLYLELEFGIGELEMDVSREGLQYTKQVKRTLREKTQEIFLELKRTFSEKIAAAKTKVEAITTYYTLNDLAGGWGVGASWTDSNGKSHPINSGEDLDYKIPAGKSLYVFNYKSAGYRSRRLVALTDKIHQETLTGKGTYYWNNSRKSGGIKFFLCDVKGEESAKKIVTRFCNQNDCFAYLLMDTKDYTKCSEGFDKLIEDVGQSNFLKVSDYKHLTQSTGPRKTYARDSKGSISDQDVFYIYGASKDAKAISNQYNDAEYLSMLSEDELEDFLEQDEIVYVPMLRYASASNEYPSINSIAGVIKQEAYKGLVKQLFGSNKIYAIKTAFADKLKKEGYNLVDFNTFLKNQLKKINSKKFEPMETFNSVVKYCKSEWEKEENRKNGSNYYYNRLPSTDKQFLFHALNLFGLKYADYIKNDKLVKALDDTMLIEFFAETVHCSVFNIRKFSESDYFDHMNKIFQANGMSSINSKDIRDTTVAYGHLIGICNNLYKTSDTDNAKEYISLIKPSIDTKYTLPKISEIRDSIRNELDKNPMLKFIISTNLRASSIRDLVVSNPISQLHSDGYWGNRSEDKWYTAMDNNMVDLFRVQLSSLIK